jgi:hypothetical protein
MVALRSILMLSIHLLLGLPRGGLFLAKILYAKCVVEQGEYLNGRKYEIFRKSNLH